MIIALGEQANALQHLVLENRAPLPESGLEIVKDTDKVDAAKW